MSQAFNGSAQRTSQPPTIYLRLNQKLKWFKWLALVGGIGVTIFGTNEYYKQVRLKEHGVKTEGTLAESSTLNTGKGRKSFAVVIDFDSKENKQGYRKPFNVPEKEFNEIMRTGKTTVIYLPNDPTLSVVGHQVKPDMEPIAIGVGLILAAIAAHTYLWWQLRRLNTFLATA
jgi:hypothetical protein